MTSAQLLAWLLALPLLHDGHGFPIPRPLGAARVIAEVAAETEAPQLYAALLDVLAAHESAYHPHAVGDHGRSCGAYQTPCARTPRRDARGQTRLAVKILRRAIDVCPGHPVWAYATGRCARTAVALRYEAEVRGEMAVPLPDPIETASR